MNNEEKKAIEKSKLSLDILKDNKIKSKVFYDVADLEILLNLIEKQQKEIEDKKEEIYTIAKTNYTVGVLDERDKWYKKINELLDTINVRIDYLKTELSKISIEIEKGTETETDNLSTLEYYYEEELKCRENQKNILQELIGKEE